MDTPFQFQMLCHNVRMLVSRYAMQASFSEDAKGGGPESNIKLVPYLAQVALHLLDLNEGYERMSAEKLLAGFLNWSDPVPNTKQYITDT